MADALLFLAATHNYTLTAFAEAFVVSLRYDVRGGLGRAFGMQFLIVSGPFFLILPVIKNRVNYNFFAFSCVKYGKWESSNNASSEIGIAFCVQIWEAEYII